VTERATGRHRAVHKSSTPLSTLTGSLSIVGDCVGSARRSGVIIAMSSGLVASMALPAHAVNAPPEAANGPATASIPVVPAAAGQALFTAPEGGLLALPPDLATDDVALAAPAAATIEFDHASFTVVSGDSPDDSVATPSADESDDNADDAAAPAPTTRKERRQAEPAPAAPAATTTPASTSSSSTEASAPKKAVPTSTTATGSKAVAIAFRYEGTPYVWGGSGPRGFDCSGFTRYVYKQLGKDLGRTVADQRGDVKFVPRSKAKAGDLVFFGTGHIGIYLGGNMMIDSPRSGKRIQARKIYSSNVQFGQVR
jgi:cell wall-associated NlpC family hydrolase